MYKLPDGNDEIYNKYITHLTKEDLLNGVDLTEALSRRLFSLTLSLGGGNIPDKELGGLEFEMDMGVDDWPIGQVTYKKLAFTVANDSADIEDGMRTGQVVKPVIGLQALDGVNKETTLKVPYGTYIVDSIAKDMTMKNYSCYDWLYYINDIDCDFGGETYPTTVGHILSTITGKYADKGMIPLSDDHQGDWAEWWYDEIGQPKKYKDYEGPVEEEEDDGIDMDPFDPVDDNFPEDAGSPPTKNPGKCCDCEPGQGGGGGTTPKPEGPGTEEPKESGILTLIKPMELLFTDRKHLALKAALDEEAQAALLAEAEAYAAKNNIELENIKQSVLYEFKNNINHISSIESSRSSFSVDPDRGDDRPLKVLISPKKAGKTTVSVTAKTNFGDEKIIGVGSIELDIPQVTKESLMKKYWNDDGSRTLNSDLSGWDVTNRNGGGFYTGDKPIHTEEITIRGTGSSMSTTSYSGNDKIKFATGGNNTNMFFYMNPCEVFNARYAVVEFTYIHKLIEPYIEGFCVVSGSKDTTGSYLAGGDKTNVLTSNTRETRGSGHKVSGIYAADGKTLCVPNFFVSDESYETNFQSESVTWGNYNGCYEFSIVYKSINQSDSINQQTELIKTVFGGGGIVAKATVTYYGKGSLTEDEYLYLTDGYRPGNVGNSTDGGNYGNGGSDYPHYQGYMLSHIGAHDTYLLHHANCPCRRWENSYVHYWDIDNPNNNGNNEYRTIDPETGDYILYEESIWRKYEDDVYDYSKWNKSSSSSNSSDENASTDLPTETVSLMSLPRTISAPAYNEDGNLIVTYAEEPDPNDPAQTPNEDGQVLVTTPEEIGFEMKEGQMLGYIAAYCGGNLVMDHTGEVRLLRLTDNITTDENGKESIGYDKHIPNSQVAIPEIDNCEASSTLGGLIIHTSTYEGDDIKLGSEKPTQTHYVLEIDNPFMTEERASEIFEEMSSLTYFPMRVIILSDPRLWLGDLLYFDGFSQYNEASGVNVEVIREGYYPVMKLISHYDGAPSLQIEANCSSLSDRSNSFTGTLNDKIDEVSAKVTETNKTVNEMKYEIEEIRALVGYFNELFAIEVNADNIVSATINTRNIRIAPVKGKTDGGLFIDGDSIDFIDNDGVQRLHIGSHGDDKDYYIRFVNENGYTRDLRALDPGPCCCDGGNNDGDDPTPDDPGDDPTTPDDGGDDNTETWISPVETDVSHLELYESEIKYIKVRLTKKPSGNQNIYAATLFNTYVYFIHNDGTCHQELTLEFTPENYNEWQTVRVVGLDHPYYYNHKDNTLRFNTAEPATKVWDRYPYADVTTEFFDEEDTWGQGAAGFPPTFPPIN